MTESLDEARCKAADAAFQNYDFGDSVVCEVGGWEYVWPGAEYTRAVFFENSEDPGRDSVKGHFAVMFDSATSAKVRDAYAMIEDNLIGFVSAAEPSDGP